MPVANTVASPERRQVPARKTLAVAVTTLTALMLSGCVTLPPEVRNEDIAYETLGVADALGTLHAADEPARFHELNPVMGPHPSPGKVVTYFAVSGAVHYGVTALLVEHDAPRWLIRTWEISGLTLESACLANNAERGATPTLSFHMKK